MLVETFTVAYGANGKRFMQVQSYTDNELTRVFLSRRRLGKRGSVLFENIDPFFDRPAEFLVVLGLLITVDATQHKSGARADIALVFFRPLENIVLSDTINVNDRLHRTTMEGTGIHPQILRMSLTFELFVNLVSCTIKALLYGMLLACILPQD